MTKEELSDRLDKTLQNGLAEIAVGGQDQFLILNLDSRYVIRKDMLFVYHAKGVRQYPIGKITRVAAV